MENSAKQFEHPTICTPFFTNVTMFLAKKSDWYLFFQNKIVLKLWYFIFGKYVPVTSF